jgi:isopentenyl diphosphate isomerase/L-lactate dehydrogenase-like FMN-dependent dehydrogenase
VTVDGAVLLARDRDYRNRTTVPLRATPRTVLGGLRSPAWLRDFALGRVARGRGFPAARNDYWALATTVSYTKSVTADDLAWLRSRWHGPLIVKGIMRGEECATLIDCGIDAVIVSNHGGRLLDGTAATIDVLPEIVAAVDGQAEVLIDGGIRRGSDIVKALALGARACLIGRPYLWGLAAGGQAGVEHLLEILGRELEQAMALAGCATIEEIDASIVGYAR